jgi:hypothetical protein
VRVGNEKNPHALAFGARVKVGDEKRPHMLLFLAGDDDDNVVRTSEEGEGKDRFLALGGTAGATNEQHGQHPDHAEKYAYPTAYHRQVLLALSVESTPRRKRTAPRTKATMRPKVRVT